MSDRFNRIAARLRQKAYALAGNASVVRLNGAPSFDAQLQSMSGEVLGSSAQVSLLTLRYPTQASPLQRDEQLSINQVLYRVRAEPDAMEDGGEFEAQLARV
jgi:hypothetical protein